MRISSLQRWHWIVIALAVGWTGGLLWQGAADFQDELEAYTTVMTDRRRFEQAVAGVLQGQRQFRDIVVYPYRVSDRRNGQRLVHVVTGWYWDGRADVRDGQATARYVRACFLANVPYVPSAGRGGGGGTVLDYLNGLQANSGLHYRYAWWWWMQSPTFVWLATSLLVIGGLWPSLVSRLAFGTWRRPKDAPTFSFWEHFHARKSAPARRPVPSGIAAPIGTGEDGQDPGGPTSPDDAQQPAVRRLASTPLQSEAAAAHEARRKAYGAGATDFYPTELRHPAKPDDT